METPLQTRAGRHLTALYTAAFVFEWFSTVALMVLVYNATSSALAATAMLLCRQLAPLALVSTAMPWFERWSPRTALSLPLFALATVLGLFATLGYGLWLYPLAAASGTFGVLFRGVLRGSMARSLEASQLRRANATLNVLVAIAAAVGPALAAVAVDSFGPSGALGVAGIGTLALAAFALATPAMAPGRMSTGGAEGEPASVGLTPSPRSALTYPLLLVFAGLVMCVCAMDEPALLGYAQSELGAGVTGYGAIYVAWGVGAFAGSVAFSRLLGRSMLAIAAVSGFAVGLAYLGMGLSGSIVLTCALAVLGGAGNGAGYVALVTAVQEAARSGDEVRAAAKFETVATAAPGIGIVLGGLLADVTGPRSSLVVPGVVCLLAIAIALLLARAREARAPFAGSIRLSPTSPGGTV